MARNPKKKLTEVPLIMRGRSFTSFYEFDTDEKYLPLKEQLNEKKYPVSKTDASYRTINSWSEAGLLLEEEDRNNGWRKFSILDLVWLEILKELRAIGFGLEKLQVLKKCLFENEYVEYDGDTTFFAFYTTYTQIEDVRLIVLADGTGTLAWM
jgi:DNA-binding transcriptional MerR regulator